MLYIWFVKKISRDNFHNIQKQKLFVLHVVTLLQPKCFFSFVLIFLLVI